MKYLNQMRSYHLAHHYKNYITGFGITSTFWDSVFGTLGDSGMIRTSTSTPPPNHSAPLSSSSSTSYGTSKRVN
ncbi:hypothetical protein HMI56_005911 [Coelomomyces lativittatus]|nr:hypothetical protein HMI56_005911 [Coelomomyces lativittatus]